MKYCFIINPVAGCRDSSKELIPEIFRAAKVCGIPKEDLMIHLTSYPRHAHELAAEAARAAAEDREEIFIYSVGGDGTFNEVLTGVMPYGNAAAGLLPYGSGNDFLRSFGTREEFCNLAGQLKGRRKTIDMIRTHHGYAASICSVGLDAKVAYGIPKFRRFPFCGGALAYKLSILEVLLGKKSIRLHIKIDETEFERDCLLVAVCNGCTYGGGFQAAPEAKVDDGVLDVMVVRSMPLSQIARILPAYQAGRHFQNGSIVPQYQGLIEYFPAHRVEIRLSDESERMIINEDGECSPDICLTAEVEPLAARIVLPATEGIF